MKKRSAAQPKDEGAFHHGNLREALVARTLEVLDEEGLEALALRRLARDLAVDPASVYRHFRGLDELRGAAAQACFAGLSGATEQALASVGADPSSRVRACGEAYVAYALAHPARFRIMFRPEANGPDGWPRSSGVGPGGRTAWDAMADAITSMDAEAPLALGPERTARVAWAAVHGLAALLVDGPLRELRPTARRELVRATIDVVLAGIRSA